jgi:hypothetical protein
MGFVGPGRRFLSGACTSKAAHGMARYGLEFLPMGKARGLVWSRRPRQSGFCNRLVNCSMRILGIDILELLIEL